MKVLLTGAAGQLGQALVGRLPEGIELVASSRNGGNGLVALDLADACLLYTSPSPRDRG